MHPVQLIATGNLTVMEHVLQLEKPLKISELVMNLYAWLALVDVFALNGSGS